MKILLAGHLGYNMIIPFCKGLKLKRPDWYIGAIGLVRPGTSFSNLKETSIDELVDKNRSFTSSEIKPQLYSITFIINLLPLMLKSGLKFSFLKKNIITWATKRSKEDYFQNLFSKYQIVNLHYIADISYSYLKYVNQSHKLMLTFWGSDLMTKHSDETKKKQFALVKRADLIILHSQEMKKIFISKFGENFASKVQLHYFGLNDHKFKLLDSINSNKSAKQIFCKKFNLPNEKLKILVGYSASPGQQHIKVINELKKLQEEFKNKIHLLIPLTYNNEDKLYYEKVKKKCENLSDISTTVFEKYLTDKEISTLYSVTDVFINVRSTDSFNGTMIECLYLNKFCIIGDWLPYSMIKKAEIEYQTVKEIKEINKHIQLILENKIATSINKDKIYKLSSNKFTINKWVSLFEKLNLDNHC